MKKGLSHLLIATSLFLLLWPAVCGYWVKSRIEHRMKMPVKGTYVPVFLAPRFYLKNAEFEMPGKVKLLSGHLKVDYDPFSVFWGNIRVKLSSDHIQMRLLGAWAELEGVEDAAVDHFEAEVGVGPQGLSDIYAVNAKSQSFQFQIKKSEV